MIATHGKNFGLTCTDYSSYNLCYERLQTQRLVVKGKPVTVVSLGLTSLPVVEKFYNDEKYDVPGRPIGGTLGYPPTGPRSQAAGRGGRGQCSEPVLARTGYNGHSGA